MNAGPAVIARAVEAAGFRIAFGLPGTQNLDVFEALRRSSLRTVTASHELGAAFMANGYYRAGGEPALLVTIPGPGFTYALTGIAEARLDSAALVHLTVAPARSPGKAYQLQAVDQAAIAGPLVKGVLTVAVGGDLAAAVLAARQLATAGEPGPVLLQLDREPDPVPATPEHAAPLPPDEAVVDEVAALLDGARRVVLLAGQGAAAAGDELTALAERVGGAVVTTTSGRGVVPEDHRLSLGFELGGTIAAPLNALIAASDIVLAIGCKFSHNGSRGFDLRIPPAKLIHVDAAADVLGANYPARLAVVADATTFLSRLVDRIRPAAGWSAAELDDFRQQGSSGSWPDHPEPRPAGSRSAAELMQALRALLPRDAILVTDSGQHQMLARRYYRVLAPRGLVVPTNLQSMSFAIAAAIGARLAAPERRVVALLGDGGLLMSGLELLTAVRTGVTLTAIVLDDGSYGLIKRGQLAAWGTAPGSELLNPDYASLAKALGCHYVQVGTDLERDLADAFALPGVTLVVIPAQEAPELRMIRARGLVKRTLGDRLIGGLKRLRG